MRDCKFSSNKYLQRHFKGFVGRKINLNCTRDLQRLISFVFMSFPFVENEGNEGTSCKRIFCKKDTKTLAWSAGISCPDSNILISLFSRFSSLIFEMQNIM